MRGHLDTRRTRRSEAHDRGIAEIQGKENQMSFYTHDDEAERLHCDSLDDAMQEYTETVDPGEWTREVEIYRFESSPFSEGTKKSYAERAIGNLIESLDEDHSDPDGDGTEITDEMMDAAREFVDKVLTKYESFWLQKVETIKIDLVEWYELSDDDDDEVKTAIARLRAEATAP